jgi:hypothetical protein
MTKTAPEIIRAMQLLIRSEKLKLYQLTTTDVKRLHRAAKLRKECLNEALKLMQDE